MEENYKEFETEAVPHISENRHVFNETEKGLMTQACAYVYSMSKWMKFFFVLMILGIIFMGIFGLVFACGGSLFSAVSEVAFPVWLFGMVYLACACLYVAPAIYMRRIYKAADQMLIANDNAAMVEFLKNNKSLWKYFGILTIVLFCLSITVFPLIGALVGLANL
jgi:hypothetical protein